jgi:predicted GNAT family N-acyltransferase
MPMTESCDTIIEEFHLRLERAGLAAIVIVDINSIDGGGLSLDRLVVDKERRGQGLANRVVSLFVQLCDDYAQHAEVIPKPLDEKTTREGLERLYSRHGFVVRVGGSVESLMRRTCR